ncbi:MAG: hypothetical protein S4CHLAM20_01250 [Chlamydiia bacterium]|nr:hypothetical protein [Chlamydiia bacterium]
MKKSLYLILLLLISCNKTSNSSEQVLFHDDGLAKPKLAVVKVIDNSSHNLEWDLSTELTDFLVEQLFSSSRFYLTDDFHLIGSNQLKSMELSPYSDDMRWLLEMNSSSEFVLFTEILNHHIETPISTSYNPLSHIKTLHLSLRICVLDIRRQSPKVILQETINKTYSIPFAFGKYEEDGSPLTKNTFALSPIGIAHKSILSEATKEIEDYILIAQSNMYE